MSKFAIQVDVIRGTEEHGTKHDDVRVLYSDGSVEESERPCDDDAVAFAATLLPDCKKNGRLSASCGPWFQLRKVGGSRLIVGGGARDIGVPSGIKQLSHGELVAIEAQFGKSDSYTSAQYVEAVKLARAAAGHDAWCDKVEVEHAKQRTEFEKTSAKPTVATENVTVADG